MERRLRGLALLRLVSHFCAETAVKTKKILALLHQGNRRPCILRHACRGVYTCSCFTYLNVQGVNFIIILPLTNDNRNAEDQCSFLTHRYLIVS